MLNQIGLEVLANWVSMLRADIDGAIWIADHPEDARFYESCAHESSRVVPAPGIALDVHRMVRGRGIEGVVVTVCGATECATEDIFKPDLGDVISLILMSKSGQHTISRIVGETWLKACDKVRGAFIENSVRVTHELTVFRRACAKAGVILSFSEALGLIDWNKFRIDQKKVASVSELKCVTPAEVRGIGTRVDSTVAATECNGVEIVGVIAAAINNFRPRGIQPAQTVDTPTILSMLRVGFDLEELGGYRIFWKMRAWQRREGYKLLREWRALDPLQVLWDQRYWQRDLAIIVQDLPNTEPLSAFKIDLDNFKNVNDTLGHSAGDEALRVYCTTIKEVLGKVAEIYRRGGDEVVALAPGLEAEEAFVLAEELRTSIEKMLAGWSLQRHLTIAPTASIGVVAGKGQNAAQIVKALDETEKAAKDQGKNRVISLRLY